MLHVIYPIISQKGLYYNINSGFKELKNNNYLNAT